MFSKNKKRNDFILVLFLIIIFIILFYSVSLSLAFRKGFPAPTFTLKTIEEETFDLEDFKEKQALLVLYFYSTDSYDSLRGIGELDKYFRSHITKKKYEIFLVNIHENLLEDDITLIKNYLDDNKIIFPVLLDEQNEVSRLYNIEKLPTAIFLDKNLIVKSVYTGFTSMQQYLMFQHISYLLDGSERIISKKEKEDRDSLEYEELFEEGEPPIDEEPPTCCSPQSLNL